MTDLCIDLTGGEQPFSLTISIKPYEAGSSYDYLGDLDRVDIVFEALKKQLPALMFDHLWDCFEALDY